MKSELETQDTSLDAYKMMHSSFPVPRFLCIYFYFDFGLLHHYFSIFIDLLYSLIHDFLGRLKVIALASAVGVSAGLITLTVAIMIR